jgi:thioredoxin 1
MAWTDQCKIEAVKAVDHKIDQGLPVRAALKEISKESDIPAGTLKRWKYPEKNVPKNGNTSSQTTESVPVRGWEKRLGGSFYDMVMGKAVRNKPDKNGYQNQKKIISEFATGSRISKGLLLKWYEEEKAKRERQPETSEPEKIIPPAPELTNDDFEEKVIESKIPVLVDFYQPTCGPCISLSPIIDKLALQYADRKRKPVKIFKCKDHSVLTSMGIKTIPHLSIFKDGKRIDLEVHPRTEPKIKSEIARAIKEAA